MRVSPCTPKYQGQRSDSSKTVLILVQILWSIFCNLSCSIIWTFHFTFTYTITILIGKSSHMTKCWFVAGVVNLFSLAPAALRVTSNWTCNKVHHTILKYCCSYFYKNTPSFVFGPSDPRWNLQEVVTSGKYLHTLRARPHRARKFCCCGHTGCAPCTQARIQAFGQGGPVEFWPQGALSPKFAQNRAFSLKITWKLHDFEEILGERGLGPHWIRTATCHSCRVSEHRLKIFHTGPLFQPLLFCGWNICFLNYVHITWYGSALSDSSTCCRCICNNRENFFSFLAFSVSCACHRHLEMWAIKSVASANRLEQSFQAGEKLQFGMHWVAFGGCGWWRRWHLWVTLRSESCRWWRALTGSSVFKMAAGCCGVKKQKLNNSMPSICCNGSAVHPTKLQNGMVIRPDMCFFCFDVLYSHLHSCEPPKTPLFTNEPL